MPSGLSLGILPEDLTQIVESAFESMLGLEVCSSGLRWVAGSDRLTAIIHLTGNWSGAVLLECSAGLACQLAGRFLSIEPPADVDDMVRDVLGELANIIGGNLKCVLAQGVQLSLPSILEDGDPVGRARKWLGFECAYGPLWIAVLSTAS